MSLEATRTPAGESLRAVSVPGPAPDAGAVQYPDQGQDAPSGNDVVYPTDTPSLQDIHEQLNRIDPAHASKVLSLAQQTDLPAPYVDKNVNEIAKVADRPDSGFFAQVEAKFPGTTQFLQKPENMVRAHDDIRSLTQMEGLTQDARYAHGVLESARSAFQTHFLGQVYRAANPEMPPNLDALGRLIQAGTEYTNLPLPLKVTIGLGGAVAGGPVKPIDPNAPLKDRLAAQVGGLAADMPAMAAFSAATGGLGTIAAGAAAFGGPAALNKALELHLKGDELYGNEEAWKDIALEGGKQALVGALTSGAGALAKGLVYTKDLAPKFFGAAAVPLAAEVATMGTAGPLVEGQAPSAQGYLENALLVGGLHAAHLAGEFATGRYAERRSQVNAQFYDKAGKILENSQVAARDPDLHASFVDDLVKDSPVEKVMISPEVLTTYLQSKGIDPETAIEQLGAAGSMREAQATGQKVEIPYSTWLSRMGKEGGYEALKGDITFNQDDLSPNEITARRESAKAATTAEAGKPAPVQAPDPEIETIKTDIANQLKEAGLTAKEVKYGSQLYSEMFRVLSQKYQIPVSELQKRFPLEVRAGTAPTSGGTTLNQDAVAQAQAPAFYSKLERTVQEKMGGSASPEQINGMLREIKPEERQWSGLDAFLAGKQKVGKQELLDFLQENQIQIKEVVKGVGDPASLPSYQAVFDHLMADGDLNDETVQRVVGDIARGDAGGSSLGGPAAASLRQEYVASFGDADTKPKFNRPDLVHPGGENYREVLFTLPPKLSDAERAALINGTNDAALAAQIDVKQRTPEYQSSHFYEPNVLAHVRLNDRTDMEGHKILFAEEIQSDWHQEGRKKGYKSEDLKPQMDTLKAQIEQMRAESHKLNPSSKEWEKNAEETNKLRDQLDELKNTQTRGVPNAPFKKTWHEFALKKILRMAAEQGYDKVAWTKGEEQNKRYDLSKQISHIQYDKAADLKDDQYGVKIYGKDGEVLKSGVYTADELTNLVGKDVAQRIVNGEGKETRANGAAKGTKKLTGDDLKLGGSGMIGFYDKMLVDAANKLVKKSGSNVENGYVETANGTAPSHEIAITPALKQQILGEGFSLFQGENTPRGQITFKSTGEAVISLFKNKDKSTFLHESSHYFLHIMGEITKSDTVPDYVKEDHATLLKWLDVESFDKIGTKEQEQFAKGFEAYLREGRAPSEGLRKAFYHFKSWLTTLYKNVKDSLGVELTDEIRGVMDRMVATQDEIDFAQKLTGIEPPSVIPGLDPALAKRIGDFQERARDAAEGALLKEQMKELTDEHKAKVEKERERLTKQAKEETLTLPVFAAIEELKSGVNKFTINQYKDPRHFAEKFISGKMKEQDAVKWELMAHEHGFEGGEDLALKITQAVDGNLFDANVKAIVDQGMAQFGDMKDTGALRLEALKAVHTERGTELLALERQALQGLLHKAGVSQEVTKRNRIEAKVEADAVKEQAAALLSEKSVKEAGNPRKYVTAERVAAVKVAKALAAGDFEKATEAKHQQMLNHALATEAYRNREEAQKAQDFLAQYATRGTDMKGMSYGFIRQIDDLLSRFGVAADRGDNTATLSQVAKAMAARGEEPQAIAEATGLKIGPDGFYRKESLKDFLARVNENYYALSLPDGVMDGGVKDAASLTLGQLLQVQDAVKSIAKAGKTQDRYLEAYGTMDIRAAASQARTRAEESYGMPHADSLVPGSAFDGKWEENWDVFKKSPGVIDRWLGTMLSFAHKLDGLKEGPWKDHLYRPFSSAENRMRLEVAKTLETLEGIYGKHYEPGDLLNYRDTRVDVGGRKFKKEQLLSALLNFGNEENIQRLKTTFGMDEPQILSMLETHLEKRDFDFAQEIRDHLDSFWPSISALEMEVNGFQPIKVEAKPFRSKYGEYPGGYYPISYDPTKTVEAFKNFEEKNALYKQFSISRAHTAQGHTEARISNVNRPLDLSLNVIHDHLKDVVHDLEFRRAVIDVSRFLNQKDTKLALSQAVGVKGYSGIGDWVKFIAGGSHESLDPGDRLFRAIRFRATQFNLGFKLKNAPKIAIENGINLATELGMSGAARAIKDYALNSTGSHEFVVSKSPLMAERAQHLNREMSDINDQYTSDPLRGPIKRLRDRYMFAVHAYLDQIFSFPLFMDAYRSGLNEHGDDAKAVHQAEEAVKRTFMSGSRLERSSVLRSSEKMKSMTIAFGYQSMMYNRFAQESFRSGMAWRADDPVGAAAIMARATIYTLLAPAATAVLSDLITHNAVQAASSDEEKRAMTLFLEEATPLKFIPVIRDLVPFVIKKVTHEPVRDVQFGIQESALQQILEPAGELLSGNLSDRFDEKAANAFSLYYGFPKQANDVVFNFLDWQKGNGDLTYRDFVTRRTKK